MAEGEGEMGGEEMGVEVGGLEEEGRGLEEEDAWVTLSLPC